MYFSFCLQIVAHSTSTTSLLYFRLSEPKILPIVVQPVLYPVRVISHLRLNATVATAVSPNRGCHHTALTSALPV